MTLKDIVIGITGERFYIPIKNLVKKALCIMRGVKKCGVNVYISPRAVIRRGGGIALKDNVVVERGVMLWVDSDESFITVGEGSYLSSNSILNTFDGWIKMGKNCTVNNYAILYGHGGLEIGDNVRIAAQVVIIPMNHIYEDPDVPICRQGVSAKGIKIEDDVWLGAGAKITDGVTVGRGSVIGAGAVVTKDIPPYSVAVGVPARVVKKRGEE